MDRLFDPGPVEKKKAPRKGVSAGKLASDPLPIYEVTCNLTKYYLRAHSDDNARKLWRFRYEGGRVPYRDDELKVRRLYHSDIVELIEAEPKLAVRLNRL